MDVAGDLRCMLADFGEPVIVAGVTVKAKPAVASVDDSLGGEGILAGRTRTLTFSSADVPDLKQGDPITWRSASWRVNRISLASQGYLTRVFLGAV